LSDVIAVFAKAPRPGEVKTRLAHSLGSEVAADLYKAMLLDSLALARKAARPLEACEVILAYTPSDAFDGGQYSLNDLWAGPRTPQCAGSLGDRIFDCCSQLQAHGAERVVIIGSDAPNLPPRYICRAFSRLDQKCKAVTLIDRSVYYPKVWMGADIALGPAKDGGFYLLGASCSIPLELFQNVAWSTASTLAQVVANAERLRLRMTLLPQWRDIDSMADLQALIQTMHKPDYGPRFHNDHKAITMRRWLQSKELL